MNSLVMKSQAPNEIRSLFGIAFELYSVPTLNGFSYRSFFVTHKWACVVPNFLQVVPFVVLSCYPQNTVHAYAFNLIFHYSQGFTTITSLLPFGLVCNLTFFKNRKRVKLFYSVVANSIRLILLISSINRIK